MKVILRSIAEEDVATAVEWHEQQRAGLGDRLLVNVREALSAPAPAHSKRLRSLSELRRTRPDHVNAGQWIVVSKAIPRWRLWRGGSPTWKRIRKRVRGTGGFKWYD